MTGDVDGSPPVQRFLSPCGDQDPDHAAEHDIPQVLLVAEQRLAVEETGEKDSKKTSADGKNAMDSADGKNGGD